MSPADDPAATPASADALTGTRRLAGNTLRNLIGLGVPTLVALAAIPILVTRMGVDRFGVLQLIWLVVGYFGLFDMGLGRATTQLIARQLGLGERERLRTSFWSALAMMTGLGVLGMLAVAAGSGWLVRDGLAIPPELQSETLDAFRLVALGLPLVVSTPGLRGVLEAHQRFGQVLAGQLIQGITTFLAPLAVLPWTNELAPVVLALLFGRSLAWIWYFAQALRLLPEARSRTLVDRRTVTELLRFGGWMTVSNIVSPLMVHFDRFLVAAMVSAAAVAYYATPGEIVMKALILPSALVGVMFPAFATTHATDPARTRRLFTWSTWLITLALLPVAAIAVALAPELLGLWLGEAFRLESTRVLQIMMLGILFNGVAHAPSALVQGLGRPDLSAWLHLIEIPIYGLGVWWLVGRWGILGAAVAWTARAGVDMLALLLLSRVVLPAGSRAGGGLAPLLLALALASAWLVTIGATASIAGRLAWTAAGLVLVAAAGVWQLRARGELRAAAALLTGRS